MAIKLKLANRLAFLLLLSSVCSEVLFDGSPENGKRFFVDNCQRKDADSKNSKLDVVDTEYGKAWRFTKPKGDRRCELHGRYEPEEGKEIYIAWRAKLTLNPKNLDTAAIFQWHAYPGDKQDYPVVLKTINGNLHLYHFDDDKKKTLLVNQKMKLNTWYQFVLFLRCSWSVDDGKIMFWINDQQQTFLTGDTEFVAKTMDGDHSDPKWGIYGGQPGSGVLTTANIKIATSYEEATETN